MQFICSLTPFKFALIDFWKCQLRVFPLFLRTASLKQRVCSCWCLFLIQKMKKKKKFDTWAAEWRVRHLKWWNTSWPSGSSRLSVWETAWRQDDGGDDDMCLCTGGWMTHLSEPRGGHRYITAWFWERSRSSVRGASISNV